MQLLMMMMRLKIVWLFIGDSLEFCWVMGDRVWDRLFGCFMVDLGGFFEKFGLLMAPFSGF
jgi:hypothetical protein